MTSHSSSSNPSAARAEVLASAIRNLLERDPVWVRRHRLHFLFVGDGYKMPEVRAILAGHAPGEHVTFAGLVPQLEAPLYLAASDILASPHVPNADASRFFGSPTKLFEYMAMGKAIIASDLDQIGEVLAGSPLVDTLPEDGEANLGSAPALLCRPGDTGEIVRALKLLAASPRCRATLGANARRLALNRYTWRHHVRAIVDQFEALGLLRG